MAKDTYIQWCDSTLNLMMGCDGCELWEDKSKVNGHRTCYAGRMTEELAGKTPNFPASFDKPVIYPERIKYLKEWNDFTGKDRKGKFWLNGFPRVIFLNDMGDAFTKDLPLDWLAPFIPQMEQSPHIFMMLSRRVRRMAEFWRQYGAVPANIWLGTSVTSAANKGRAYELTEIPAQVRWLSVEPMLGAVEFLGLYTALQWIIVGFESGEGARKGNGNWMRLLRDDCEKYDVPFFVKQMGGDQGTKRGAIHELPVDLRIRQAPVWEHLQWPGRTPPSPQLPLKINLI